MDEDFEQELYQNDLEDFALKEIDEDRAAGEYDPTLPEEQTEVDSEEDDPYPYPTHVVILALEAILDGEGDEVDYEEAQSWVADMRWFWETAGVKGPRPHDWRSDSRTAD